MNPILVVDDEFDISEVIASILRGDGYPVEVRANGREAIAYLEALGSPPSLVILDVMMPFVDGYEVIRFMKGTKDLADVPVILMSAVQPALRQKDVGWDEFLRKPFTLEDLTDVVERHVGKRGQAAF